MSGNMDIWDAVSTTDPGDTKKVTFGRTFTAIDAYSQIMAATKQFGPVGEGWGFEVDRVDYPEGSISIFLKVWHGSRDNWFPAIGQKRLFNKDGKPDEESYKKALTDGITKGLSYLGFNADVFLGMYDDHKYVESLKQKKPTQDIWPYPVRTFGNSDIQLNPSPPKNSRDPNWKGPKTKGQLRDYVSDMCDAITEAGHADDLIAHKKSPEMKAFIIQAAHDYPQMLFSTEEEQCMPDYLNQRIKELENPEHPGLAAQ